MRNGSSLTEQNVLGLIADNCPDLTALLDVNGFFLYGNAAHFIRLGRTSESLQGASIYELLHAEDVAAFEKVLAGSAGRRTLFRTTARWVRDDGRTLRFDSMGKWIVTDSGRAQYLLLCSRESLPADDANGSAEKVRSDATLLLSTVESEKNEVARTIHDDLGQKLTAMSLELSLWKVELDQGQSKSVNAIREKITVLTDLVSGVIQATRGVTSSLRPRVLDEFGLTAAIEWHLEKVQKQSGVACNFSSNTPRLDLDSFTASQVFRIVEEVVAIRVASGCKALHLKLVVQPDTLGLVWEDSGKDRRLNPELCARVRLLGGEIEIANQAKTILIALPLKEFR
jgi:PAS domain S-box-containing protein